MPKLAMSVLAIVMATPVLAFAATTTPSSEAQANVPAQNQQITALKVKQDLEKAGFSDVKVMAESFVVQAKSKEGNPVLMTIGPTGMAMLETSTSPQQGSTPPSSTSGTKTTSQ